MHTMRNVGTFARYAGAMYTVLAADETTRLYVLENVRTGHRTLVHFDRVPA
jgi:hypothetical protein